MTKLPEGSAIVKSMANSLADRPIGDLMRQAHRRLVSHLDQALRTAGCTDVSSPHVSVLATINAEGSRLATLVERGGRTKQATAELAGRLTAQGYADLVPDPTDGRAKLYVLTQHGLDLLRTCEGIVVAYEEWLDGVMGPRAVAQLRSALTTIVENEN